MFSVGYLFGLDLLVWVNSGGACVVTHNYNDKTFTKGLQFLKGFGITVPV